MENHMHMRTLRWTFLLVTAGCTINSALVFAADIKASSCRSVDWNRGGAGSSTFSPGATTGGIEMRLQLPRRSTEADRTRDYCPTPPNYCVDPTVTHCGSNQGSASPS